MSHVAIWKFRVLPDREVQFRKVYGPDGVWERLFRKANGFLSTELLSDPSSPRTYITIDRWRSEDAYRSFRCDYAAEYAAIDRSCEEMTESEEKIAECVGI